MIAEERANYDRPVRFVSPSHHRPKRAGWWRSFGRQFEGCKGQRRCICEIAWHQKAARGQQTYCMVVVTACVQIFGEQSGGGECLLLVLRTIRIKCGEMRMPSFGDVRARGLPGKAQTLRRPHLVSFCQERQVEKPFSRVIDNIQSQCALVSAQRLVLDNNSQFANLPCRSGPTAFVHDRIYVALVIES